MVLRGSKIRPESTLEDASAAVERARDFLRQTREQLHLVQAGTDLKSALSDIKRRKSLGEPVSPEELENIVRLLLDKIDALERAELEANGESSPQRKGARHADAAGMRRCCWGDSTHIRGADRPREDSHADAACFLAVVFRQSQSTDRSRSRFRQIVAEEGVRKLWRGNGVNCIRVVPYSATQFVTYDKLKAGIIATLSRPAVPCGASPCVGLAPLW